MRLQKGACYMINKALFGKAEESGDKNLGGGPTANSLIGQDLARINKNLVSIPEFSGDAWAGPQHQEQLALSAPNTPLSHRLPHVLALFVISPSLYVSLSL